MALKLGELVAYLKADDKDLVRGLAEGKREFERTGDEMDKSAKATSASVAASWVARLAAVAGSWRSTGQQASTTLDKSAADTAKLDTKIGEVETSLRDLNLEFARTGDKELFAKITKDRSLLANLQRIRKELHGVGDDADGAGEKAAVGFVAKFGAKFGGLLPDAVSGVFGSLPPQAQAAVAAAAVAIGVTFAAAAGAAIAAGVLLAVGGGVLAAGIKAAADSPQVKTAWTQFGDRAKAAFKDFGKPFEGPLIRAADTFGDALERMAPTLKSMGVSMAPMIDKLAPALASMAEKALPGIQKAMEASKPLFDKLAEHAPKIGEAMSKFFQKMADAGPGATLFLDHFLSLVEFLIVYLGNVVLGLAKIYEVSAWVWSGVASIFIAGVKVILGVLGMIIDGAAAAFGWIPGIGPKLKSAAEEFHKFSDKANGWLNSIKDRTVSVTIEQHFKMFGKPGTDIYGIGGNDFKGRAVGGPVGAGVPYIVGEKGWEVFVPDQPGRIVPHHEASAARQPASTVGAGTAGGDTHVYVTIDGQQLEGRIDRVVQESNRGLKRRVMAGAGT